GLRIRPTRVLVFVPVERRLRPCIRAFRALRDKVTSSAQSLSPSGRPSQGSGLPILTEPHDELAALHLRDHSITSSARTSSVGGRSRPSALAVLRLMTNSNLVGNSTGRSATGVPFSIL